MIKSWSHSRIVDFEKCNYRAYLKYAQRIPEPPRPLKPGQTEQANDRGTRVHTMAEDYVRGTANTLPAELKNFPDEFERMRELYKGGAVSLEGEWGMDIEWAPTAWESAWLRLKLDAFVVLNETEAVTIDYKTGRKFGNEIKHDEQLRLYQLCAFLRYPQLETIHTELWYLDVNELTRRTFTRAQGLRFKEYFHRRGLGMTTCMEFKPNPNKHSCRYCEYGPWNGGQCKVGVRGL